MPSINSTVATGRAGYDSFDCAQAVALIGFLGLISNFQDIIETFTNNANGRRRRRSGGWGGGGGGGILTGLSQIMQKEPWEALQPVLDMVSWASDKQPHISQNNPVTDVEGDTINRISDDIPEESANTRDKPKKVTPFVNDVALFGPQLALWVVDVADGRISGEEGRNEVCQTINTLGENHGLIGSLFGNLLTQTVVKAMASHSPAEKLLQKAELRENPNPCWRPQKNSLIADTIMSQIL